MLKPITLKLTPTMFDDLDKWEEVVTALDHFYDIDKETGGIELLELNVLASFAHLRDETNEDERHPSLSDSERNPSLGKS